MIDAVAAGAVGYLTKDADAGDIRRAVRAVANGQTYVSPTLASYLINANRQKSSSLKHQLSPRELEILSWLLPVKPTATSPSSSSSPRPPCTPTSSESATRPGPAGGPR